TKMKNVCSTGKGWEYFAPHSFMWLNNREGPTANVKFRQAVMYAMDREFVRDVVWHGFGNVATGPVSSKTRFYSDDVTKYDSNPEKAKALLGEMGYDGSTVCILPLALRRDLAALGRGG
ncbi:MAG: peptide/nickel transport system substrate-binding protein, partial [Hyphomicrobiaceae bacterium]